MSAKFYTLLTEIGAAKLASAAALGVPLKITQMAVGDGGGVLPTPSAQQTALVAEKRRASLNMLYIDPQNSSQIIAEQVIPETEGGWWIREVGLFDETGALIAVGNCPESYKPQLAEGSGRTQTVRMVLITSSTENITLKIDPSVVLATRKYVDDKVLELKVYVDDQMSKHVSASDPHKQYAPKDSPTLTGTPKAPTPAQSVSDSQIATTAFVKAALAALVGSSPAALDTLNELAAALGNDANFATTMTNALAGKQPLDNTLTSLSGKDVAGLLSFLGLGETAGLAAGALQKENNLSDVRSADSAVRNIGACRAFSGGVGIATLTNWTTQQFLDWLKRMGAFAVPYWMCKGSWSYGSNPVITDSGLGVIQLAGAVIEVMGSESAKTIRVTTPTTTAAPGGVRNAQFIYIDHGADYYPGWRRDYNTSNTTVASDGTLKAASPIVKIFGDGSFETNIDAQGATVTKSGIGEYLIQGVKGLNADAIWSGIDGGFDIPKNRNGQALIWLDYEVNADGSILVKTYHRTYPEAPDFARNFVAGYKEADPIDIPLYQFVSVRVEMTGESLLAAS